MRVLGITVARVGASSRRCETIPPIEADPAVPVAVKMANQRARESATHTEPEPRKRLQRSSISTDDGERIDHSTRLDR